MATEVDNRVVQMTFNNSQFEKGVDKTLKTIDKLNKALKFENASDGFEEIQNAADSVNLKTIADKLDALTDKFSAFGIIGMTIWSKIGSAALDFVTGPFKSAISAIDNGVSAVTNQVKTGGWNRALNLEQAEFLIEGLGFAWEKGADDIVDGATNIYNIVDKAVTGTAYSLDEAAKVAGSLLTSNVSADDGSLLGTLRAISGVAAMTSSDFQSIGDIFGTVAGQGKLMTMQLRQLESRGLNAAAILADALGTTQETVRDMVTDGAIDFETFSMAMEDAFGDKAQKANETFTGSLSNVKSALSRIGARFAEPLLAGLIQPLNEARLMVNAFGTALDDSGITGFISDTIGNLSEKVVNAFTYVDEDGIMHLNATVENFFWQVKRMFDGLRAGFYAIGHLVDIFKESWDEVFGKKASDSVFKFATKFRDKIYDINHAIATNEEVQNKIKTVMTGILTVAKVLGKIIGTAIKILGKVLKVVAKLAAEVFYLGSLLIKQVKKFKDWLVQTEAFKKAVEGLNKFVDILKSTLDKVKTAITNIITKFIEFVKTSGIVQRGLKVLKGIFKTLYEVINTAWIIIKGAFTGLYDAITDFITNSEFVKKAGETISKAFKSIKESISTAVTAVKDWVGAKFENVSFEDVRDAIVGFFTEDLPGKIHELGETLTWAFSNPNQAAKLLLEKLNEFKTTVSEKFSDAVDTLKTKLGELPDKFNAAKDSFKGFADGDIDEEKTESKISLFEALASALDTMATGFQTLKEVLGGIFTGLWNILKDAYDWISEKTEDFTFADFVDLVLDAIRVISGLNWAKAAANITQFFKDIDGAFKSTLTGKSTIESVGKAMLEIAATFAIFAWTFGKLSQLDQDKMSDVTANIAFIIMIIAGMIILVKKFLSKEGSEEETSGLGERIERGLDKLATGLSNGLEKAIKNFSKTAGLAILFGAIAASIGMIVLSVIALIAEIQMVDKSAVDGAVEILGIIGLMLLALILVAGLLVEKSKSTGGKLFEGLAGIALLILAIGSAISMIVLAIVTLGAVAQVDNQFDSNIIKDGFKAVIGVMVMLLVMTAILAVISGVLAQKGGGGASILPMIGIAVLVLTIASAALLIIPVILAFAALDGKRLWSAVGGLFTVFVAMAIIMGVAAWIGKSGNIIGTIGVIAAAGLAAAGILYAFSLAADASTNADTNAIIAGLVGIALIVMILSAIAGLVTKGENGMQSAESFAVVVIALAAAIFVMAKALQEMKGIKLDDVKDAIVAIGIILLITLLITVVIGALDMMTGGTFSKALESLGIGFLGLGAGIFLIAAALYLLGPILDEFADHFEEWSDGIEALTTVVVDILISFIEKFITALKEKMATLTYEIGDLLLAIIIGVIVWLTDNAFQIGVALGDLMFALIEVIGIAIIRLIDDIFQLIKGPDGVDEGSPSKKMLEIGKNFLLGLINGIKEILEDLWECIKGIIDGILEFFFGIVEDIFDVGKDIINSVWDGISSAWESVEGFIGGIADGIVNIFDAASDKVEGIMEDIFSYNEAAWEAQKQAEWSADFREKYKKTEETQLAGREDEVSNIMEKVATLRSELIEVNSKLGDKNLNSYVRSGYNHRLEQLKSQAKAYVRELEDIYKDADYHALLDANEETNYISISSTAYKAALDIGEELAKGYNLGIYNNLGRENVLADILGWQVEETKEYLGIHSPSKLLMRIGKFMIMGLNEGLEDEFTYTEGILSSFATAISSFDAEMNSPTITPVLDTTQIQNGIGNINSMMANSHAQYVAGMDVKSSDARNAERLNDLTAAVNNLTIKTDQIDISGELGTQSGLLGQIVEALANQNIVLDSGALVGGITTKIDKALGARSIAVGRRAY